MPITGVMSMHMPVLTSTWKNSEAATPVQTKKLMVLLLRSPTYMQRMITRESSNKMARQAIIPSSSPAEAKIKSVCLPVRASDWVWMPLP